MNRHGQKKQDSNADLEGKNNRISTDPSFKTLTDLLVEHSVFMWKIYLIEIHNITGTTDDWNGLTRPTSDKRMR